jgi:hypothetical protein
MNVLKKFFVCRPRFFLCVLALVSLAGVVVQCQAQPYTLTSQNSSLAIDVASGPGNVSDWVVDGLDQLNSQWFYYRAGSDSQEYPVESIGTPLISTPALNRLDATYANSSYSVKVSYTLTGNTLGSGKSGLSETITIKNLTASSLTFHFYQYSDFDLGGVTGGQNVQITTNPSQFLVTQTSGGVTYLTESATLAAVPYLVEAASYDQTLLSLTDNGVTTLNGSTSAGPGNVTFAGEWDMTLNASGTKIISKVLTIVPEPASVTLILSGLVVWGLMHRRGRNPD